MSNVTLTETLLRDCITEPMRPWSISLSSILAIAAIGTSGCDDRTGGGGIRRVQDTGTNSDDAGVRSDATAGRDANPSQDSGAGRDTGGNDAGAPDSSAPPDTGVPPQSVSVRDLQDDTSPRRPPLDTAIRLSGVVVTATQMTGGVLQNFWVQETSGGPYSGILIFVPPPLAGTVTVQLGDRLSLTGRYTEYFEVTEVVLESIDSQSTGSPPQPEQRTTSELAMGSPLAEAYEGVLVRIPTVSVTNSNPDAPMDFGEFQVDGIMRVDDAMYRVDPRPLAGSTIEFIIGIQHHAFMNYKLLPRTAADVGPIF